MNSPYCDPGGNAHGGMLAWDVDTRMDNTHTRGLFLEVTEFDSRAINEVIYQKNGVTTRTIPAIHSYEGPVSFILER